MSNILRQILFSRNLKISAFAHRWHCQERFKIQRTLSMKICFVLTAYHSIHFRYYSKHNKILSNEEMDRNIVQQQQSPEPSSLE